MFQRMYSVLMIPLSTCMVISAMGSINPVSAKAMGLRALGFYVAAKFLSSVTAFAVSLLLVPGHSRFKIDNPKVDSFPDADRLPGDMLADLAR